MGARSAVETTVVATATRSPTPSITEVEDRWRRLKDTPRTPTSDREREDCLRKMAQSEPTRALALALAESDPRLRERFRNAVLTGWATNNSQAAATWAMGLPSADRTSALGAIFAGAQPDDALHLYQSITAQNPGSAADFGQVLLAALTEAGAYERAAHFAAADSTGSRDGWLSTTFFEWASHQPEAAMRAMGGLSDAAAKKAAFQGLVAGWAAANPTGLADYAIRLSPGENRAQALHETLPEWVRRDPLGASEWMVGTFVPSPELDGGMATVATLPNLIAERPELAVTWAENIVDPSLRTETLRRIAHEWSERDANAVRSFMSRTANLPEDERKALLEGLNAPPGSG